MKIAWLGTLLSAAPIGVQTIPPCGFGSVAQQAGVACSLAGAARPAANLPLFF